MQLAGEAKYPAEGRQLIREHMQTILEKMRAMRGMVGDVPMKWAMGGQTSSDWNLVVLFKVLGIAAFAKHLMSTR